MLSTILSTTAVLLSALNLVNGQTFTDCNPLTNTSCPSDPALGGTQYTDFTSASSDWSLAEGTTLSYGASGAEFTIKTSTDAPTISSTKYIFFGKVSVTTKAAPGTGIVSSFILESDDLDEIDWEWLGSTDSSVESNFFGKGNTTTYDRAVYHNVATPIETWHTYTIDWTSSSIQWIIDGVTVRTLAYGDALALGGKNYPQTPMRIKMGNWVGCASVAAETATATQGTCSWAGGAATFGGSLSYTMYVLNVTIEDYGCGTEYTYGDETGSYQSIKTSGDCNGSTKESSSSAGAVSTTSATTVKSTSSAGIFVETSSGSSSGSAKATATNSGTTTAATTMSTATGSATSQTSSSSTSSSSPAKVTTSDANSSKPKHQYGIMDFGVIALGLGLGYLVM